MPLVFIGIFSIVWYFFRNVYTTMVAIVALFGFVLISSFFKKRDKLEIQGDTMLFIKHSGEPMGTISIRESSVIKIKTEFGPGVLIVAPDGRELKIATSTRLFKWKEQVEEVDKYDYQITAAVWVNFLKALHLENDAEIPPNLLHISPKWFAI